MRRVLLVVVSLILGVMTSIGLSWLFANDPTIQTFSAGLVMQVESRGTVSWARIERKLGVQKVYASRGGKPDESYVPDYSDLPPIRDGEPWWLPDLMEWMKSEAPDVQWETTAHEATGWPLVCMISVKGMNVPGTGVTSRGIWLMPRPGEFEMRVLSFQPIWRGLAVNTILFGGGWFVLGVGVGQCRQVVRRMRGRCPMCGYILHGGMASGCPECGWNRVS